MFDFAEMAMVVVIILLYVLVAVVSCVLASHFVFSAHQGRSKKARIILLVISAALVLAAVILSPIIYNAAMGNVRDRLKIVIVFDIGIALLVVAFLGVIIRAKNNSGKLFTTKNITRMAVFTALSVVLYQFVKFPLPFIFPSFLDIQFSEMPALLAGFMMGPFAGAIVVILKILIKLPFTSTGGVGELGDLILGLVFVLSASGLYRILRTKKGALISLVVGSVLCIMTAILINRYVLIPFYTTYMFPWQALLKMVGGLYPGITKETFYKSYLWLAVLPFNTLRCLIVVLVTFFMYKPTKRIFGLVEKKTSRKEQ